MYLNDCHLEIEYTNHPFSMEDMLRELTAASKQFNGKNIPIFIRKAVKRHIRPSEVGLKTTMEYDFKIVADGIYILLDDEGEEVIDVIGLALF